MLPQVVLPSFALQQVLTNFSGACSPREFDIDAEACESLPGHHYYIFSTRMFPLDTVGLCHEDGNVGLCSTNDEVMQANGGRRYAGGVEVPFDFGRCAIASSVELEGFGDARTFLSDQHNGKREHGKLGESSILLAHDAPDHIFTSTDRAGTTGIERFGLFVGSLRRRLSSWEYNLVSCVSKKGQKECPWSRWIALLGIHCPGGLFLKAFNTPLSPVRCNGAIGIISGASPYEKMANRRNAARESWIVDAGNMVVPLNSESTKLVSKDCFTYFFVIGRPANSNELEQVLREQQIWGDLVVDTSIQDQVFVPGGEPGNLLKTWRAYAISEFLNVSTAVRASDDVYVHVPRLRKLWDSSVLESEGKMVLLGQLVHSHFQPYYPHFGKDYAVVGSVSTWLAPVGDLYAVDLDIVKLTLRVAELSLPENIPQLWAQDDNMGAWLHLMARNKVHYSKFMHGEWRDVLSLPYEWVEHRCALERTSLRDQTIIVHFGGPAGDERSLLEGLAALHNAHARYGDIGCAFE